MRYIGKDPKYMGLTISRWMYNPMDFTYTVWFNNGVEARLDEGLCVGNTSSLETAYDRPGTLKLPSVKQFREAMAAKAPHDGKDDSGKPNPALLFLGLGEVLAEVGKVLDGGAKKYAADSWQKVPNGEQRYIQAFYRHLSDMQVRGFDAINEKDFNLPEIDHLITNLLFVRWFQLQRLKGNNASK